ncbi:hypothetical protein B0H14DRAFT_2561874 [Mycena olivaceomarginata]|nr:hypothetical protein B0H14DRAFT_2561874 [Mycena olivaceomarginata]
MRKVYLKFPGADYWDKLDKCLTKNRREADTKKITRVFCKFLDEDQEKHGKMVLCAHIALMGQVYLKHPDGDFWDQLDDRLDEICNEAKNDAKKLTRGFRHVLTQDQDKHGAEDYVLDETTVDNFQQQMYEKATGTPLQYVRLNVAGTLLRPLAASWSWLHKRGRDPREPGKLKQDSAGGTVRGLYESPALHTAAHQVTANEAAQWRAQRASAGGSPDDPRTRPLAMAMPVSLSTSCSRTGEGWRWCP